MRSKKVSPQKVADLWNRTIAVGDAVEFREADGEPPQVYTTRTPAEVLSGHTAVVWLNGKSGCVACELCRKAVPAASQ